MTTRTSPDVVAAVDLGSNSFHMLVAHVEADGLRVVDRLRERVALAAGLDRRKHLSSEARARAIGCLERFGERLAGIPEHRLRVVGTNTLRAIRGPRGFLQTAETALGHTIEVISGQEEARLVYLGAAHSLESTGQQRLVVDIGGGSTECIIGKGFEPVLAESLNMGCVSWSRRFFPDGLMTSESMDKARLTARRRLLPIEGAFRGQGWDEAVGCSGTVHAVAAITRAMVANTSGICVNDLTQLRQACVSAGSFDALELPGLQGARRPVIAGGVAILEAVFEAFALESMRVASGALREGVMHDLVGRMRHDDVRDRTVSRMLKSFRVDRAQARRVRRTALQLLDAAGTSWRIDDEEWRKFLCWGAHLHEVGLFLAHGGYHRHGGYIARHADMPGFSRPGQRVLAALIAGHRRRFDLKLIEELPPKLGKLTLRLLVLLRLAALLQRTRGGEVPEFQVEAPHKRELLLRFPNDWLNEHPLTCADLEDEARRWERIEFVLKFD